MPKKVINQTAPSSKVDRKKGPIEDDDDEFLGEDCDGYFMGDSDDEAVDAPGPSSSGGLKISRRDTKNKERIRHEKKTTLLFLSQRAGVSLLPEQTTEEPEQDFSKYYSEVSAYEEQRHPASLAIDSSEPGRQTLEDEEKFCPPTNPYDSKVPDGGFSFPPPGGFPPSGPNPPSPFVSTPCVASPALPPSAGPAFPYSRKALVGASFTEFVDSPESKKQNKPSSSSLGGEAPSTLSMLRPSGGFASCAAVQFDPDIDPTRGPSEKAQSKSHVRASAPVISIVDDDDDSLVKQKGKKSGKKGKGEKLGKLEKREGTFTLSQAAEMTSTRPWDVNYTPLSQTMRSGDGKARLDKFYSALENATPETTLEFEVLAGPAKGKRRCVIDLRRNSPTYGVRRLSKSGIRAKTVMSFRDIVQVVKSNSDPLLVFVLCANGKKGMIRVNTQAERERFVSAIWLGIHGFLADPKTIPFEQEITIFIGTVNLAGNSLAENPKVWLSDAKDKRIVAIAAQECTESVFNELVSPLEETHERIECLFIHHYHLLFSYCFPYSYIHLVCQVGFVC